MSKTARCNVCGREIPYDEIQSIPVPKGFKDYGLGKYILACAPCAKEVQKPHSPHLDGCGDHSCVIKKPKGQATNGGCRCRDWALRGHIQFLKLVIKVASQRMVDGTYEVKDGMTAGEMNKRLRAEALAFQKRGGRCPRQDTRA